MNPSAILLSCVGLLVFCASGRQAAAQAATSAPPRAEDQPVQLSVFEVTTERDTAYRANHAVSSNRASTPIFDTPQSITVLTEAFLRDIEALSVAPEGGGRFLIETASVYYRELGYRLMMGTFTTSNRLLRAYYRQTGLLCSASVAGSVRSAHGKD